MPDRSLPYPGHPPTPREHLLHHPAEFVLGGWWALVGAALLVSYLHPSVGAPPNVAILPAPLALGVIASIGVGGVMIVLGLAWPGRWSDTARLIESNGWIVGASGWLAYLVATLWLTGAPHPVSISFIGAMVSVAVGRLLALRHLNRSTRAGRPS